MYAIDNHMDANVLQNILFFLVFNENMTHKKGAIKEEKKMKFPHQMSLTRRVIGRAFRFAF